MDSTDTQTAVAWWTLDRRQLGGAIDREQLHQRPDGSTWWDRRRSAGSMLIGSAQVSKDRIGPLLDEGFAEVDSRGVWVWTDAGRESRRVALEAREAATR